jgi:hypothetical protein
MGLDTMRASTRVGGWGEWGRFLDRGNLTITPVRPSRSARGRVQVWIWVSGRSDAVNAFVVRRNGTLRKRHRRGLRPRHRQRFGGQTEVDEDLLRDVLLLDAGVVVGRGTTCARRRLVGAKTPCRTLLHHLAVMKRVKFAYVGGMRG